MISWLLALKFHGYAIEPVTMVLDEKCRVFTVKSKP